MCNIFLVCHTQWLVCVCVCQCVSCVCVFVKVCVGLLPSQMTCAFLLLAARLMQKERSSVWVRSSPHSDTIFIICHSNGKLQTEVWLLTTD